MRQCHLNNIHFYYYYYYYYYYYIHTDGSKSDDRVGAAVVHRNKTKCVQLLNTASIFRAELYALLLTIDVVRRSKEKHYFVIFSDSMSSLQAINSFKIELDLVQRFIKDYSTLSKSGKQQFYAGSLVTWVFLLMKKRTRERSLPSLSVSPP